MRHLLKAVKYVGNMPAYRAKWMMIDTVTGEAIGGQCPEYAMTRAQMYRDCDQMFGSCAPWFGRRVRGGYSIKID